MFLVRMGPRFLFIRTENIDQVTRYLEEALKENLQIWKAFEKASDNNYSMLYYRPQS